MSLDVTEVTQFRSRLAQPADVEGWAPEWSERLADEIIPNVPVDTGEYRDSIEAVDEGVVIGADHWRYVEYGTTRTPAQPVVVPALNRIARPATEDAGNRVIRQLTA